MTIDPDIRDQAYQFFIEEASELLDIIETGLLDLRQDVTVQKVHELMRAAHSIKGGAASVDLDVIKTIAHRLEDVFKALYSDTVVVDQVLETMLLQAYDCLRQPLQDQIDTGTFNKDEALSLLESRFSAVETHLGPALAATDGFMPSAADLGVDIVASIFEVDVAEGLNHLRNVLAHPHAYNCGEELKTQLEVLNGLAELVALPGFMRIVAAAQSAANRYFDQPLPVIEQLLVDVDSARTAVLNGDRLIGGEPSSHLITLARDSLAVFDEVMPIDSSASASVDELDLADLDLDALDEVLFAHENTDPGEGLNAIVDVSEYKAAQVSVLEEIWTIDAVDVSPEETLAQSELLEPGKSQESVSDVTALLDLWSGTEIFDEIMQDDPLATSAENSAVDGARNFWEENEALEEDGLGGNEAVFDEGLVTSEETVSRGTEFDESTGIDLGELDLWLGRGGAMESSPPLKSAVDSAVDSAADSAADSVESAVGFIGEIYGALPMLPIEDHPTSKSSKTHKKRLSSPSTERQSGAKLSAKVALERLERMDNLVGELAINRNSLSLQNDQFQRTVRRLGQRFSSFRSIVKQLQSISDQILITPDRRFARTTSLSTATGNTFDSLEMDSYGAINSLLEGVLEEVFQLAESIDDVALFAGHSNQLLERQRRTLTQLRDELMWSRMVPLDRVLKRFPRVIRDLSTTYQKPVELKLTGMDVLVDRVMLEKLYDPLLHLLRNAFDHGIEPLEDRRRLGKPEQGTIEIRAYHRGNYTVVELSDDGQGLDLDRIAQRAIEIELLLPEQVATLSPQQLQNLIFEPGFSTASEVSELSGRGVGLDVVRDSLQTFNGKLSLTTHRDKGTVFSLKIPLTLTLTKLVVGSVGTSAVAIASDSIEEILKPRGDQLKQSSGKRLLHWRDQLIPAYDLAELLSYQCTQPEQLPQELRQGQTVKSQQPTMLIIQQGQGMLALGLERIVTEQELVIKPMGKAIAAPSYINGCTVLADGSLVPVIDGAALVQFESPDLKGTSIPMPTRSGRAQTLMIVDDSSALRRTLALTLSKAGYRVLQAKDGRDALDQLQRGASPQLIICDVEMPRLNGFEFLSQRRVNPIWGNIPTVMLTSRGNHKHRTLAKHLGAVDYFTKPYIEKEFVDAIATLLTPHTS